MSSAHEIDLAAEDLLVRARRNELSDNERRKLRALLEASKELELLYLAGVALDRSSALVAGDEARMQRLVELGRTQVQASVDPPPARLRGASVRRPSAAPARSLAAALCIGAVLGAAVSAAFQHGPRLFLPATPATPSGPTATPTAAKPARASAPPRPTAATLTPLPAASVAFPPVAAPVSATPRVNGVAQRVRVADASALFAQASEARRNGESATAIRLYEQLCARYASSVEAADARVILGKLKLQQHAAAEALRHFEDYPAGTLSAEALWGRAEALKQLSSPAERATLERIVRDYPDSPYALAARKRLQTGR